MWFSLHSDCHKPAAALSNSLKCFPDLTLLQFPHSPGAGPVLLTLLLFFPFLPSSYWFLHGSSGQGLLPVSAGDLQGLLHLKRYSDVSLKRDAFYVWLLFCHLSFCLYESFKIKTYRALSIKSSVIIFSFGIYLMICFLFLKNFNQRESHNSLHNCIWEVWLFWMCICFGYHDLLMFLK